LLAKLLFLDDLWAKAEIPCKFPANSLVERKICEFWAEFEALNRFRKYFPVFFPALGNLSAETVRNHPRPTTGV
jgi:hypothetical protein